MVGEGRRSTPWRPPLTLHKPSTLLREQSRGWWAFAHHDKKQRPPLEQSPLEKRRIQILPLRVKPLNQTNLPRLAPALGRFPPLDRQSDFFMALEVNQPRQPVSLSKTSNHPFSMYIPPPPRIRRNANVKRAVRPVRHEVDITACHTDHRAATILQTRYQNLRGKE